MNPGDMIRNCGPYPKWKAKVIKSWHVDSCGDFVVAEFPSGEQKQMEHYQVELVIYKKGGLYVGKVLDDEWWEGVRYARRINHPHLCPRCKGHVCHVWTGETFCCLPFSDEDCHMTPVGNLYHFPCRVCNGLGFFDDVPGLIS